jgi:hypothetical protein
MAGGVNSMWHTVRGIKKSTGALATKAACTEVGQLVGIAYTETYALLTP